MIVRPPGDLHELSGCQVGGSCRTAAQAHTTTTTTNQPHSARLPHTTTTTTHWAKKGQGAKLVGPNRPLLNEVVTRTTRAWHSLLLARYTATITCDDNIVSHIQIKVKVKIRVVHHRPELGKHPLTPPPNPLPFAVRWWVAVSYSNTSPAACRKQTSALAHLQYPPRYSNSNSNNSCIDAVMQRQRHHSKGSPMCAYAPGHHTAACPDGNRPDRLTRCKA